jgi:hypothetical protein
LGGWGLVLFCVFLRSQVSSSSLDSIWFLSFCFCNSGSVSYRLSLSLFLSVRGFTI